MNDDNVCVGITTESNNLAYGYSCNWNERLMVMRLHSEIDIGDTHIMFFQLWDIEKKQSVVLTLYTDHRNPSCTYGNYLIYTNHYYHMQTIQKAIDIYKTISPKWLLLYHYFVVHHGDALCDIFSHLITYYPMTVLEIDTYKLLNV